MLRARERAAAVLEDDHPVVGVGGIAGRGLDDEVRGHSGEDDGVQVPSRED